MTPSKNLKQIHLLELEIDELKQKKRPKHLIEQAKAELKLLKASPALQFALDNINNKDKLN